MTLLQITRLALEQAALDWEQPDESRELLITAANAAYDELVNTFRGSHVGTGEDDEPPLKGDRDIPDVPEWCHRGICDYVTYCLLRGGGGTRPGRAQLFWEAWRQVLDKARQQGGSRFVHVPR